MQSITTMVVLLLMVITRSSAQSDPLNLLNCTNLNMSELHFLSERSLSNDPELGCESINVTMFTDSSPGDLCATVPFPMSYSKTLLSGQCYSFADAAMLAVRGDTKHVFHFDTTSTNCSGPTQIYNQQSGLGVDCIRFLDEYRHFRDHLSGYWTCEED